MSEEAQESMLDEPMQEIAEEKAIEEEANPQVIDNVFAQDPEEADTTIAAEDEETEFERPDYFPEKFWDTKEGPDIEGLVKSYGELEKNFSKGKHKSPESYDIKFAEDKGVKADDALLERFQGWAKEHGVSQAAFEALANDYIDNQLAEIEQFEINIKEEKNKLGPNADSILKSTALWADGLYNKGVLNENELEAFKQTGATADGVRALQKIRRFYGEATVPVAEPTTEGLPTAEELYAMVGKPEYKSDPAFRNKVQKWFKQRFPDDPNTDYII